MAKFYDNLTPEVIRFIEKQHLFFVATAPLASDGHVNLSPKGLDTLRILAPDHVAYLDLTGSGNETAAHLHENGRITIMFCSFGPSPSILRLYGRGEAVLPGSDAWQELVPRFELLPGTRQILSVRLHMVQDSCGWAVPRMDFREDRATLVRHAEAKGEDDLHTYRLEKNTNSLDGLPVPVRDA